MKLNENGNFCLLYVEPADEKQTVFETIGTQTRPVVLMLPLAAGQARSRLFQRPEDFSDLKYVRRQTGVSIIFVTSGSELLAQMATRYGFPAYASIDALAETLSHGRKADHDSGEHVRLPLTHRVRTGPLVPSAAQLAAIQRAMPSGTPSGIRLRRSVPSGPLKSEQGATGWTDAESDLVPVELEHSAVAPLNGPADMAFWPGAQDNKQSGGSHATPLPPIRANSFGNHSPVLSMGGDGPFFEESPVQLAPRRNEIPPRRAAQSSREQHPTHYSRHPGWETEEQVFEVPTRPLVERSPTFAPETPLPTVSPELDQALRIQSQQRRSRSSPDLSAQVPPRATRTPSPRSLPLMPPVQPPTPKTTRPHRGISPVLLILSLLILAGAGLGSLVVITRMQPTAAVVARPVGTVSFLSSGQMNNATSQGIDDQIQISLHGLAQPASGKSYYAWLLGDLSQPESQPILLGKLNVVGGSAKLLYPGDAQHTNLLQVTSRFLVTEESSISTPLMPTPDTSAWRYYGAVSAVPNPDDPHHFAFLNHLRHLLADEPVLDELELPGGLNKWFAQNVEELVQWTSGARDQWQAGNFVEVRNQGVRILSYLDGMSFLAQDIPAASANDKPSLDTRLAGIGLLNLRGANQNPPSFMDELAYHLNGLLNSPGSPSNTRSIVAAIQPVIGSVNTWLGNLRNDDKQLLALNDTQLGEQQAFSLLDDMVLQSSNAYSGSTDPSTGQFLPGVSWMHQELQALATINISTYLVGSSIPELGPSSTQTSPTVLLPLLVEWKKLLEDLR